HEGKASAENRHAHRARGRRQIDDGQQPRHLYVCEHGAIPGRRAEPLSGQRARSGVQAPAAHHALRVYAQDDYRVTPSLTLNLGARYEFFTIPSDRNGLDAYLPDVRSSTTTVLGGPFVNPSLRNIAPRVGFAWDVSGDGRTAVRGGSGLYY